MFKCEEGFNVFCKQSKIGSHHCSVSTSYGWSCDFCLYDELMWLNKNGVHTVNSCCGHGDEALASILVEGDESADFMRCHAYEKVYRSNNKSLAKCKLTEWVPKTNFPYRKKKFKIEEAPAYWVMHCPTKESAKIFCDLFMKNKNACNWWDDFKDKTCYNAGTDVYDSIDYYEKVTIYGTHILEFNNYSWDEYEKED